VSPPPTLLIEGANQPMFCCPTPEISGSTTVSQTFRALQDNLCAIRVMFSSPVKQSGGEITFVIREAGESGKTLYFMSYPLQEIDDFDRCCFIFPPIPNSRGEEYLFTFSAPALRPGKGISLWYHTKSSAPRGSMLVNGDPVQGTLYFQAYCFTGEHPEIDWQGRKEMVIDQGWYLSVRELQLYYERTRLFREKTSTHEKFELIGRALINRKVSSP